ncbi:MAG TPA: M23 family metallopeptidase [bacterium]|nr:M23 family metallopeptidase [bacterium]
MPLVFIIMMAGVNLISAPSGQSNVKKEFRERTVAGPRMFRLPVDDPEGKYFPGPRADFRLHLLGVDHKPQPGRNDIFARAGCKDYRGRGFPHCYGNHRGSDFILKGGFKAMDREDGRVVAAADGVVTAVDDGHYDRCRASVRTMEVSCHGHEKKPNLVVIRHANGYRTLYYHFKKNTIAVKPGDAVKCGRFLGLVGSSGESSLPHLHFEIHDLEGYAVDPFSVDPEDSMWVQQDGPHGLPAPKCAE